VPPRKLFDGRVLALGTGGRIPLDRLQSFLRNNGYSRTETVREPGEYAVRGGIVDLYPAGAASPIRLDFFGEVLESLRSFDPLTQRSTGPLDRFVRGFSSWRFSGGSPYDDLAMTVLANLGLTTQLAVLGLCLALGAPSVYLWLAVACFLVLGALHLRAEVRASTRREA